MKDRIRPASWIQLGPADDLESIALVEIHSKRILFVDINMRRLQVVDSMAKQHPAQALADVIRMKKKHLDVLASNTEKTDDASVLLHTFQVDGREILVENKWLEVRDVFFGDERVRGPNGCLPDFDDFRVIRFKCLDNRAHCLKLSKGFSLPCEVHLSATAFENTSCTRAC